MFLQLRYAKINDIILNYYILYDNNIIWFKYCDIYPLLSYSVNKKYHLLKYWEEFNIKSNKFRSKTIFISEKSLQNLLKASIKKESQYFLQLLFNIRQDIMYEYILYNIQNLINFLTNKSGYIYILQYKKIKNIIKIASLDNINKYKKDFNCLYCFHCDDKSYYENLFHNYLKEYKIGNQFYYIKQIKEIFAIQKFIFYNEINISKFDSLESLYI